MRRAVTPTALARVLWLTREEAWVACNHVGRALPWKDVDLATKRVYVESARALLKRYVVRAKRK